MFDPYGVKCFLCLVFAIYRGTFTVSMVIIPSVERVGGGSSCAMRG